MSLYGLENSCSFTRVHNSLNVPLEGGRRLRHSLGHRSFPILTVIVPCLNVVKALRKTVQSVLVQDFPNLELIVIDGGSTDGTLEYLRELGDKIEYWISEQDAGISNAFNKGLAVSKGEYINFQGAGDLFLGPTVISDTFEYVEEGDVIVSARIHFVSEFDSSQLIRKYPSKGLSANFNKSSLIFKMSLPHQGLFVHREYFESFGSFDETLRYSMDYEHLLRSYHDFPGVRLVPVEVSAWQAGGIGALVLDEVIAEYHLIRKRHNIANPLLLSLAYYWQKTKLLIRRVLGI